MCSAKAASTIKQNKIKNREGGHLFNERVVVHCLKMAQRQRLVNILSKTDGQSEARKREPADIQTEKVEKR